MKSLATKNQISKFPETPDIETASDGYASRFTGSVGEYFLNIQSGITLELLKPDKIVKILDVGGGHAQLTPSLINAGYKVTVTGSADVCRRRLESILPAGSFDYLTCDLLNLPYDDNHFDAVLAFRLLPHVKNWHKLIAEMCRVSVKVVIFDYPDIRSFNFLYQLLFGAKKALEGNTREFQLFKRNEIIDVLKKLNFGSFILKQQFFIPMVIHRMIKSVAISRAAESILRVLGLTYLFGSPVILKASKLQNT